MKIKVLPRLLLSCAASLAAFMLAVSTANAGEVNLQSLTVSAESGDAEAQFRLARIYLLGTRETKPDAGKAFQLMQKAAEQGHADALGGMGYFYATGTCVPQDPVEALAWFRKGAEKGSAKAQLNLGLALAEGKGTPVNEAEARKWIESAAQQSLPEGQATFCQMMLTGRLGLRPDYAVIQSYAAQAAESGVPKAQNILGVLYRDGLGVKRNVATAEMWFRKAAEQGDPLAESNLGHVIGLRDPARRVEALTWLLKASNQGDVAAGKTLDEVRGAMPPDVMAEASKRARSTPGL